MPTLAPLLAAAPVVQVHVAAALIALALAPVILIRRKGGVVHRWLGRVWVVAMTVAALSSFWIQDIRLIGPWSPIHLLSVLTLASLAIGLRAAIRRDIATHRKIMESLAFWALGVTGLFTLLPGRDMNAVLFGDDSWAGFGATATAVALVWLRWRGGVGRQAVAGDPSD
jgi:uncharacterized membrane protein